MPTKRLLIFDLIRYNLISSIRDFYKKILRIFLNRTLAQNNRIFYRLMKILVLLSCFVSVSLKNVLLGGTGAYFKVRMPFQLRQA